MGDTKLPRRVTYELRSMVPRLVDRCQGNCGKKLLPADEQDYLLVKSWGHSNFFYKGENKSKYGPQYIHFKEYAHFKHKMHYDEFPYDLVEIDKDTLSKLSEEGKASRKQYGLEFI